MVAEADENNVIRIDVPWAHLLLAPAIASSVGFITGLLSSSSLASLQFLAENAHRQPTTVQGWYFYQKTKNYRVLLAGFKGGLKTSVKLGAWTAGFVSLQQLADRFLFSEMRDLAQVRKTCSGALAGSLIATSASAIYRMPTRGLPQRTLLGLSIGALAGSAEDARNYLSRQKGIS